MSILISRVRRRFGAEKMAARRERCLKGCASRLTRLNILRKRELGPKVPWKRRPVFVSGTRRVSGARSITSRSSGSVALRVTRTCTRGRPRPSLGLTAPEPPGPSSTASSPPRAAAPEAPADHRMVPLRPCEQAHGVERQSSSMPIRSTSVLMTGEGTGDISPQRNPPITVSNGPSTRIGAPPAPMPGHTPLTAVPR